MKRSNTITGMVDTGLISCPINLIAYNIMTIFSITAWHLIRDQHLVYTNHKYLSYLSLSIKVFCGNLFLINVQHLFINTFLISAYQVVKKIFSVSFFSSSRRSCLKVIRNIFQHAWVFFTSFFT